MSHRAREPIRLDIGEPDFRTPQHIIEAAEEALRAGLTHYGPTRGLPELREAVCDHLALFDIKAHPDEVLITPGASFALYLSFKILLQPGDEVIVPTPAWFVYPDLVRLAGGRCVFVSFGPTYQPDIEALEKAIGPRTRALMINTPNNPTGRVLGERELASIRDLALEHDIYIISDEVYKAIIYDGLKHKSLASFEDLREKLIFVDAFSKTYAMTGWRIGYLVAPKEVCDRAEAYQTAMIMCVPPFIQKAGVAALRGPQEPVKAMVEEYQARRNLVLDLLSEVPDLEVLRPQGALYVFPNISAYGLKASALARELEHRYAVKIMPGDLFGPGWGDHIRISFCRPREELVEGIRRLKHLLESLRGGR